MAVDTEAPSMNKRYLRGWPKPVADLLMHIVNDCGVKWRPIDGSHLVLYPPDGETRPFKVSGGRPSAVNQQILREQFMARFGLPSPEDLKAQRQEQYRMTTEQQAPPRVETYVPAPAPEPVWEPVVEQGKPLRFETDGTRFRCLVCRDGGGEYIASSRSAIAGHLRAHPLPKETSSVTEQPLEVTPAAALGVLASHLGVPLTDPVREDELEEEIADLNRQVAALTQQVQALTNERDEFEAKITLLRETLGMVDS